jgi:hypothetical protein
MQLWKTQFTEVPGRVFGPTEPSPESRLLKHVEAVIARDLRYVYEFIPLIEKIGERLQRKWSDDRLPPLNYGDDDELDRSLMYEKMFEVAARHEGIKNRDVPAIRDSVVFTDTFETFSVLSIREAVLSSQEMKLREEPVEGLR